MKDSPYHSPIYITVCASPFPIIKTKSVTYIQSVRTYNVATETGRRNVTIRPAGRRPFGRDFYLFFLSQTLIGCSGCIQTVSVARLLVEQTHSGLAAGLGMVCAPIPGVLLSLVAGSAGDRLNAGKLMILFDLLRGSLIFLYPLCRSAPAVFLVMLSITILDALYNPSKNKLLTCVAGREDLLSANSFLGGGGGIASLLTPVLTGLFISAHDVKIAFVFAGCLYWISALLLSVIRQKSGGTKESEQTRKRGDLKRGIRYSFSSGTIRERITALALIDFGTISVNIAFYTFAFDTLRVSNRYWGLLLSVLYGMSLFSMALLLLYKNRFRKRSPTAALFLIGAVSAAWFAYASTKNLGFILIGAAVEGLCLSLCNTLLVTSLLESARQEYTARVMGTRDLISNASKLIGIGFSYAAIRLFDYRFVFIACSALLFTYALKKAAALFIMGKRTKTYL